MTGERMRAVLCEEWCDYEELTLTDARVPEMRPGCVRIRIRYAGVSFATTLVVAGTYQRKPPLPFVPGTEVSGEVLECAADVMHCRPGDRVLAVIDWGGYAEQVVARAENVHVIPGGLATDAAVALCISYPTAFGGLCWQGRLQAGETLLVHGAAGGVGLAAAEIGRAVGARVIAVANGAEKQRALTARGFERVIETEGFREKVERLAGVPGVDVVFDPVGGAVTRPSLSCLRPCGRLVTIGFAGGEIPSVPLNLLLLKNIGVLGFNWGEYAGWSPVDRRTEYVDAVRGMMAQLFDWWAAGKIQPTVHARFDLADFREAMAEVRQRRAIGRVVLTP